MGEQVDASVGAPLEELRRQLVEYGTALADVVEPGQRTSVTEASDILRQQSCRIAVVGQIKSGKTSFVNALVRQPSLLPTEVTPWTTAVTYLHFGQDAPENHKAVFTFLDDSEWRALADSGGPMRELTERLVPGFQPQVLQKQVQMLRSRAEARLGTEFNELLGKAHCFDQISTTVVERYVCSGDYGEPDAADGPGRYSDITKRADLFCDEGPFALPCSIMDTPGTNDPFLIRDEITRSSLEAADMYIVVLTARQPLAESDVALLRLMRGLNKDRIVVLVNRIDDLADIENDLPRLAAYVRHRLDEEMPGSNIPLILGSALWANQSVSLSDATAARILGRRSARHLLRAGLLNEDDLGPWCLKDPEKADRFRRSMFAMSGVGEVYDAIGAMMIGTGAFSTMREVTRFFAKMAAASESAAQSELEILMMAPPGQEGYTADQEAQVTDLAREQEMLDGISRNIEDSAKGIEAQLQAIISDEVSKLRLALHQTIETHSERERDVLIDTLSRGQAPRVWTHEGIELRRALAATFQQQFQASANRVLAFHSRVAPELRKLVTMVIPEASLPDPLGGAPTIQPPPISPISRFVALDLGASAWGSFLRRQPSVEESGHRIEELIKAEFEPVAEDLVRLMNETLSTFSRTTLKWSFGACRNLLDALQRRRELVNLRRQEMAAEANGGGNPASAGRDSERVRSSQERLEYIRSLNEHLARLVEYVDQVTRLGEQTRVSAGGRG